MSKTILNFNQILGLMILSIGASISDSLNTPIALIIIFSGALTFLFATKVNKGITISFIVFCIGFLIRIMHWPASNEFLSIGLFGLIISGYFRFIHKNYKLDLILIFISIVIILFGIILRINHTMFNVEISAIGYLLMIFSYSFRFIKKPSKNFEDFNKIILVIFWSISSIYKSFHWPWSDILSWISLAFLWIWLIFSLIRELNIKRTETDKL